MDFTKIKRELQLSHFENNLVLSKKFDILEALSSTCKESELHCRIVCIEFSECDLLDLRVKDSHFWKDLLKGELCFATLELLNDISRDFFGREYLVSTSELLETLALILKSQQDNLVDYKVIVPILQKLSLRSRAAEMMIERGVLRVLPKLLKNKNPHLTEILEFSITLLLNLSQNKKSRMYFDAEGAFIFVEILVELIPKCPRSTRPFLNGVLYELLIYKEGKTAAIQHGLVEIMQMEVELLAGDHLAQQGQSILDRIDDECPSMNTYSPMEDIDQLTISEIPDPSTIKLSREVDVFMEKYSLEGEHLNLKKMELLRKLQKNLRIEIKDVSFNITAVPSALHLTKKEDAKTSNQSLSSFDYSEVTDGTINQENPSKVQTTYFGGKSIVKITKLQPKS